jgi:hypothetical protein
MLRGEQVPRLDKIRTKSETFREGKPALADLPRVDLHLIGILGFGSTPFA